MKRILSLILSTLLIVSLAGVAAAEGTPLSVITVRAGASFPDGVNVGNSDYLEMIEALTGYDLDWTNFNEGTADELRLLLASGNAPDLIQFANTDPLVELANAGAILPLDEALAEVGQDLLAFIPEDVLDSGRINGEVYFLPRYIGKGPIGTIALRADILEALGLETPTTIEEYDAVFAAVKEQTDLIPLITGGGLERLTNFATAMGVDYTRRTFFYVVDGECTIPILSDAGLAFVEKMHDWYEKGYLDREFLVDQEYLEKMIAGNGFSMYAYYTEAARNFPTLLEKVEGAAIDYVEPPHGPNGEMGYTVDGLTSMAWIVPASSADKVNDAVAFLNAALDPAVVNLICFGIEGENWEYVDGVPTFIEGNPPVDYRGYYSRVVLDRGWDVAWEASVGVSELTERLITYAKINEIVNIPTVGVEAYSEKNGEIFSYINDEIIRLIVEGVTAEDIETLRQEVLDMGGTEIIEQVNAWLAL